MISEMHLSVKSNLVRVGVLFALFLCMVAPSSVQATKYAGAFMENGGGARALGMGGAFTAVADDPSAVFWNPAGLSGVASHELLLMHSERFGDLIDRDFVAYTQPVGWSLLGGEDSGVGLAVIRLGIDDIPFTEHLFDELDENGDGIVTDPELYELLSRQDEIRYKSDAEYALFLSYGERLGRWRMGANMKLIRQAVGDYSSLGIGFDVGVLRPRIWRHLDFGLKLQDVTTTYLSWSTGTNEVINPAVVPALAWRMPLKSLQGELIVAASAETRFENRREADQYNAGSMSTNIHAGMEMSFRERVFMRFGCDSGWDSDHLTAGAGFLVSPILDDWGYLIIDYAYGGDVLGIEETTHRISASVGF